MGMYLTIEEIKETSRQDFTEDDLIKFVGKKIQIDYTGAAHRYPTIGVCTGYIVKKFVMDGEVAYSFRVYLGKREYEISHDCIIGVVV